jgi:conjugal transfer pilus assembly protein TraW
MIAACLMAAAAAISTAAIGGSQDVTLGQTYSIAEPDVLREIKTAAAARDWQTWVRKQPKDYSAFDSIRLPRNKVDSSRLFDPTYTLPRDIKDDTGRVLALAGTKVNVYAKRKREGRYLVIGGTPEDYRWLDEVAKVTEKDRILLANENVYVQRKATKRQIFILDEHFAERLGLRGVPSIVEQEGTMLRVREYAIR